MRRGPDRETARRRTGIDLFRRRIPPHATDTRPAASLPIVRGFIVVGLAVTSALYALLYSTRILGAPVLLVAALLYLRYLAYRSVRAVERLSYG